jgi:mono/diheme cytochrome c family protein
MSDPKPMRGLLELKCYRTLAMCTLGLVPLTFSCGQTSSQLHVQRKGDTSSESDAGKSLAKAASQGAKGKGGLQEASKESEKLAQEALDAFILAGGSKGILNCPTTPLPAYGAGAEALAGLSPQFQASCATCHGATGEGSALYPNLRILTDEARYISLVRNGKALMPAFDAGFISDAVLKSDFALLKSGAKIASAGSKEDPRTWSKERVAKAISQGRVAWRKKGAVDGKTCANCHSPDGIELAVIGYNDDDILRRGQMHVAPSEALIIRDYIHAMRTKYKILETCSVDWRPFQPGGKVLPGNSPAEQDDAFMAELKKRKLMVAVGKVRTLEDAKVAMAELQSIDMRALPIGIPLPRFAEDKFIGPEITGNSANDYMTSVPFIPNVPAEYFGREDAYLKNPTDAALSELIAVQGTETNDGGHFATNSKPTSSASNCYGWDESTKWVREVIDTPKRKAVFVAAHLFRQELEKPGSFFSRDRSPFPLGQADMNPMFSIGAMTIEPPCYDEIAHPSWVASMTPSLRADLPFGQSQIIRFSDTMTHPWMTLGQVLDQTLMKSIDYGNKLHYWAFRNFAQKNAHLPFMFAHRVGQQIAYFDAKKFGSPAGKRTHDVTRQGVHPLFARNIHSRAGVSDADGTVDQVTLKGNLVRMTMLLRKELLLAGASVPGDRELGQHCMNVFCETRSILSGADGSAGFLNNVRRNNALNGTNFDFTLFVDDATSLVREVEDLLAKAPVTK